jgi:hypothetical protein
MALVQELEMKDSDKIISAANHCFHTEGFISQCKKG